jgi:hypothetical protein
VGLVEGAEETEEADDEWLLTEEADDEWLLAEVTEEAAAPGKH